MRLASGSCFCLLCRAFKYLYDGDCSICRTFQAMVEKLDNGLGRVAFVDIANQASRDSFQE